MIVKAYNPQLDERTNDHRRPRCTSCGDAIKPHRCTACRRLVTDRCRDCHDETRHGIVDGRQYLKRKG